MVQLWITLQGQNRKKWIVALLMLTAVGLGLLELWRPGTIVAIPSWIVGCAIQLWKWMGNILDAFRQLIRDITGWYG